MNHSNTKHRPEILAPAGDETSFLAALAAGADAVYAGLKHFSARMEAANFSTSQLAGLANLCRERDARVYVTLNTLLKPGESAQIGRLLVRLARDVQPHGIIVQDLGVVNLARQAGFQGEVHLSTLANLSHPAGLAVARKLGASRVVIPRELNIDEVRLMAEACPPGLDLEMFVHGALCHNVSGRCWWSTSLGGKSGLRGRCVQPCRRLYRQGSPHADPARYFSCLDLSLDMLVRPLLDIPQVAAWKIEGRKKGPHYVFHAVRAYQLLRDHGQDPQARKDAEDLLDMALGRPSSHSLFLPQRPFVPVDVGRDTASGKFIGMVKADPAKAQPKGKSKGKQGGKKQVPFQSGLHFSTRLPLTLGDLLRMGYEDEEGHRVLRVTKAVPKGGRYDLGKPGQARPGMKVFLVDRREPGLNQALAPLKKALVKIMNTVPAESAPPEFSPASIKAWVPKFDPGPGKGRSKKFHDPHRNLSPGRIDLHRVLPKGKRPPRLALWLTRRSLETVAPGLCPRLWWWLPPVIWPDEEPLWRKVVDASLAKGCRTFVLNAPWQAALLPDREDVERVLGPFANPASPECLAELQSLGFSGAIVAPELDKESFLALPSKSPLPLGVVTKGFWPLGISRFLAENVRSKQVLLSPKREGCWTKKVGINQWIFPSWELDLTAQEDELKKAGYAWFVSLFEARPKTVPHPGRTSQFNWNLKLL